VHILIVGREAHLVRDSTFRLEAGRRNDLADAKPGRYRCDTLDELNGIGEFLLGWPEECGGTITVSQGNQIVLFWQCVGISDVKADRKFAL